MNILGRRLKQWRDRKRAAQAWFLLQRSKEAFVLRQYPHDPSGELHLELLRSAAQSIRDTVARTRVLIEESRRLLRVLENSTTT